MQSDAALYFAAVDFRAYFLQSWSFVPSHLNSCQKGCAVDYKSATVAVALAARFLVAVGHHCCLSWLLSLVFSQNVYSSFLLLVVGGCWETAL